MRDIWKMKERSTLFFFYIKLSLWNSYTGIVSPILIVDNFQHYWIRWTKAIKLHSIRRRNFFSYTYDMIKTCDLCVTVAFAWTIRGRKENGPKVLYYYIYTHTHIYVCMYICILLSDKIGNESSAINIQSLLYEIKGSGGYIEMDVLIENVYVECLLEISIDNREKSHEHSFNCFAYIHKLPQCVYDFIIICNANRRSTYTGNSRSNIRHYGLH